MTLISRAIAPTVRSRRGPRVAEHEVADVDVAEHVVVRAADHGIALVRGVRGQLGRLADGEGRLEEDHIGARHHDLADGTLAGREHVVDQAPLVVRQRLVRGDETTQLVLGDRFATGVGIAAEQAHEPVRRLATAAR